MLTITFEGRDWSFEKEAITVDEWRDLKRKYKMTPKQFDEGIGEADPDASTFVYWIMLRQAGDQRAVLGDHLKPDIIALNKGIASALVTEAGEQETGGDPADPTAAAGSPRATTPSGGSGKATSARSGTSTSSGSPQGSESAPGT